jgi:hypothetical protein
VTWLAIIGGVVVGVGLIVAMIAIVLRLPASKGGLEPHSMGGDWWQNDGSGSDGAGGGHGGGH